MYQLLKWRITDDDISEWRCLDSSFPRREAYDCTINVLTFLKLLNRNEAEKIAHKKNVEANQPFSFNKGTYDYEVINHFFNISKDDRIRTNEYTFIDFTLESNFIHYLEQSLTPGYGTLINMRCYTKKCSAHAIIAAVNSSGKLVMLDPQQVIYYSTYAQIEKMIETQNYDSFGLPFKRKSVIRKADTMLTVRKSHSSQPAKKKRRLQGGKTRKTRKTRK
jgi:hypothetical protein